MWLPGSRSGCPPTSSRWRHLSPLRCGTPPRTLEERRARPELARIRVSANRVPIPGGRAGTAREQGTEVRPLGLDGRDVTGTALPQVPRTLPRPPASKLDRDAGVSRSMNRRSGSSPVRSDPLCGRAHWGRTTKGFQQTGKKQASGCRQALKSHRTTACQGATATTVPHHCLSNQGSSSDRISFASRPSVGRRLRLARVARGRAPTPRPHRRADSSVASRRGGRPGGRQLPKIVKWRPCARGDSRLRGLPGHFR